ncbi:MAG: lipoprotein [Chitinophagaceae bacterium]|nr:lipoprotein [Chitinophagaceae bacterium]MBK8951030.1 lipoprotein [Chitinophagaceae bacterium]
MKRLIFPFIILFILAACNNDKNHDGHSHGSKEVPKTQADSLMTEVMDGHDVGMAKYGRLKEVEKQIKAAIDSVTKLPSKAQAAAAPYKVQLDSVGKDIRSAIVAMDTWMQEFNMDSAVDNMEQRIKYLTDEKLKVGKVKEAILGSLQKADSLFKAKL